MNAKLKLTVNGSSKPFELLCSGHAWRVIDKLFSFLQTPSFAIEHYYGPEIECEECANAGKLPPQKPGVYLQT